MVHAARPVVARSPDLATGPTAGLPAPRPPRRETFGPARGGVGRPAPSAFAVDFSLQRTVTSEFQRLADEMDKKAKDKDIDGATLAYLR